jgi:hypothetical protein
MRVLQPGFTYAASDAAPEGDAMMALSRFSAFLRDPKASIERLRREVAKLKAKRDILKNRPGSGPPARGRNGLCYGADRRVAADSLLVA